MTKRIILSLAMMALTITFVTSAAVAYFSAASTNSGNTVSIGSVKLDTGAVKGLPFTFDNMAPGETKFVLFDVSYGGTLDADLYLGLQKTVGNLTGVLRYSLEEVDSGGLNPVSVQSPVSLGNIYSGWKQLNSTAVAGGAHKYYKLSVITPSDLANTYNGQSMTSTVYVYAVQTGQGAPSVAPDAYTP